MRHPDGRFHTMFGVFVGMVRHCGWVLVGLGQGHGGVQCVGGGSVGFYGVGCCMQYIAQCSVVQRRRQPDEFVVGGDQ